MYLRYDYEHGRHKELHTLFTFLRLLRIHNQSHHIIRAKIEMYFHFLRRGYSNDTEVKV